MWVSLVVLLFSFLIFFCLFAVTFFLFPRLFSVACFLFCFPVCFLLPVFFSVSSSVFCCLFPRLFSVAFFLFPFCCFLFTVSSSVPVLAAGFRPVWSKMFRSLLVEHPLPSSFLSLFSGNCMPFCVKIKHFFFRFGEVLLKPGL